MTESVLASQWAMCMSKGDDVVQNVTSMTRVSSIRANLQLHSLEAQYDGRSESIFAFHIFGLLIFISNKTISDLIIPLPDCNI